MTNIKGDKKKERKKNAMKGFGWRWTKRLNQIEKNLLHKYLFYSFMLSTQHKRLLLLCYDE